MKLFVFIISMCATANLIAQKTDSLRTKSFPIYSQSIRPDLYSKQMGFMCKKELQLQKAVKLPVFIRLGSLDYTNFLEGKRKQY